MPTSVGRQDTLQMARSLVQSTVLNPDDLSTVQTLVATPTQGLEQLPDDAKVLIDIVQLDNPHALLLVQQRPTEQERDSREKSANDRSQRRRHVWHPGSTRSSIESPSL